MGTPHLRHARARLVRSFVALSAAALVVPAVAAMPAQALGLQPPITGSIVPSTSGAGSITSSPAGLVCDNNLTATTRTSTPCNDTLTTLELTAILTTLSSQVTLVPAPADEQWEFSHWLGCLPEGQVSGDTCVVDRTILTTVTGPLAPTAVFDPVCDQLPANPLCPPAGLDLTAPETQIVDKPEPTTTATTASFSYRAVEADGTDTVGATFECELTGPGQSAGYTDCSPGQTKTYTGLEPGHYTFSVRASDAAVPANVDATPATHAWEVLADTEAPGTIVTQRPGRWLLSRSTNVVLYAGDAATYRCALDGQPVGCEGGFAPLRKLGSRTHHFTGAAVDAAGNADSTPASVRFTVPVNNTALKHVRGFAKKRGSGHFLNTYSVAKRRGATLTTSATGIRRIALVVTKGRGYGTVKVYLGKKLLRKVSLASTRTRGEQVVAVAGFAAPRKGTIRVVTTSRKPVLVEGVGVSSR